MDMMESVTTEVDDVSGAGLAEATAAGFAVTAVGNNYRLLDARALLRDAAGPAVYAYRWRPRGQIEQLTVHHSVTATLPESASPDSEFGVLRAIHRYHQGPKADGRWAGIGYHAAVFPSGRCWYVGDLSTSRACVAQRNPWVVGVLLAGTFTWQAPGERQLVAARRLLAELQFDLGWHVPVLGHGEAALAAYPTSCPGASQHQWLDRLRVTAPS